MARRLVATPTVRLRRTAQIRVIYADTDRMGVVYHATYLRFLEHARVEFIRGLGFAYADMERMGFGLPV
ncbi:MAG TPA: thioesterase family protein, partial [Enhygromyxa sp.]|nr:thioesterase family protein [Enhygromyxa sp.]